MKVALVPNVVVKSNGLPIPYIPLGLLSMMGCLKRDAVSEAYLLDLNSQLRHDGATLCTRFYDDVAQHIAQSGYDLVGFSTTSSSFHHCLSLARRVKQLCPEVVIVAGGPGPHGPSLAAAILTAFPFIDYLVAGEGEIVFPKLVQCLAAAKRPVGLPGVMFMDGERVVINGQVPLIANLDDLPLPDFASLAVDDYVYSYKHSESIIHLEQGRGCPFRCTYCSTSEFWRHRPRCKSVQRVLEEMDIMNRLYALSTFSLINDCFNHNLQQVGAFCREIANTAMPYTWGCSLRLDLITHDLLDRMWDSGCRAFFSGVESGSRRIQHLIGKDLDLSRLGEMLEYAARKGFHIRTSFIIGFPEETQEDLTFTMQLHKKCLDIGVAESHVNLLTPLHGSQLLESGKYALEFDGHGSTLSNNLVLEEHLPDILRYPQIFSAFYYFRPHYVCREEFIEEEMLANILTTMYPQVPQGAPAGD
jgi:radical SAM superfamily enzyme YgiQ (UPF0313 family)